MRSTDSFLVLISELQLIYARYVRRTYLVQVLCATGIPRMSLLRFPSMLLFHLCCRVCRNDKESRA